ncbi:MAG: hypothetical protein U0792_16360 [Gemmataceae bacterium]
MATSTSRRGPIFTPLGVTLFELLTGGLPYGGTDFPSIPRRIADETEPVPLVSRFRPDVPRPEAVCAKCLEKDPAKRYASTLELADEMARVMNGDATRARPRGLLIDMVAAIGSRRETDSMASWRAWWVGAGSALLNGVVITGFLLADWSSAALGVFAYHLLAWALILWWFGIRRRATLTGIERAGYTTHIGMLLAIAMALPVCLWFSGMTVLSMYPLLNAVVGCGVFAGGLIHRGANYLAGVVIMSQNLVLPFLPGWSWPLFSAVVHTSVQVWAAITLHHIDLASRERGDGTA